MFKLLYKAGKSEKEFSKLELVNKSGKEKGFSIYFPNIDSNNFLKSWQEKYKIKEQPTVFVLVIVDEISFQEGILLLREFLSRRNIKNE